MDFTLFAAICVYHVRRTQSQFRLSLGLKNGKDNSIFFPTNRGKEKKRRIP